MLKYPCGYSQVFTIITKQMYPITWWTGMEATGHPRPGWHWTFCQSQPPLPMWSMGFLTVVSQYQKCAIHCPMSPPVLQPYLALGWTYLTQSRDTIIQQFKDKTSPHGQ
ncbi:hypothetical protein MVEN_00295600 [Mycena venus]|uniref:Uncharacterized protein n=1 Tax=Mycena venus TaxID=2733690 RepID=A0A8H6Z3G5_9AGAR|nr:hypothetical protein MVEN_00295600 [Mycena venus]